MTTSEPEIRDLLKRRTDAQQSKDIDRLLSFYSPDIGYYDAAPPLLFSGTEELRRDFLRWFDGYKGPISLQTHDLTIVASQDAAFAHMLHLDSALPAIGITAQYAVAADLAPARAPREPLEP